MFVSDLILARAHMGLDFVSGQYGCLFSRCRKYVINSLIHGHFHINAWMHSLKKSVKPEIVNRYDLWVLRHKIGGAKVFVNNVQWSDQMM
jgi:hypothetical protein